MIGRQVVVAAFVLLSACATTTRDPEPAHERASAAETAPPAVSATPAPPPKPPPPPVRLTIAAVGDMMIGTDFPENHLPDDDAVGFFDGVRAELLAADLTIGNLEGVLVDGGEPAKACSNPKACYLFRSPTRYAERFKAAGFDVLSLANNHARDFGEEGRDSTMRALSSVGIYHSGRSGTYATFLHGQTSIAFIAFAVTRNSNMLLDEETSAAQVAMLADQHDIVIVSFHGGAEGEQATHLPFAEETYYGEPRGDVVRFARSMIDHGADLVVGHGPHVVRAIELYEGRLIAYSLGNFATYYGISVSGHKGIAPILHATIDGSGRFIDGRIVSTRQIRPAGPSIDYNGEALRLMRNLTLADFSEPGIVIDDNGGLRIDRRERVPDRPEALIDSTGEPR